MSRITIVVPVYKVEAFLHRCVDSILNQTCTDFELILVDDGSPDRCGQICEAYAAKDNRVTVIHKENGGLSDARNAGIDYAFQHSDSEWITFIDSDDWVHPQYLEALLNAAEQHRTDVAVSIFQRTESFYIDKPYASLDSERCETEAYYCAHNEVIIAWGKLYKKELFRDVRYPYGKIHEDEFTTYKLLFASGSPQSIAVCSRVLYYYYQNPEGIMNTRWSEKNLVILEAREGQLAFYKEHGLDQAYHRLVIVYILGLATIITEKVPLLPDEQRQYYDKALRKKLRRDLRKYRGDYVCAWNEWTRFVAYPTYEKILRKLHLI